MTVRQRILGHVQNPTRQWLVQVGRDASSYHTKYSFGPFEEDRARYFYNGLNAHSGHKKRLVNPEGGIVERYLS